MTRGTLDEGINGDNAYDLPCSPGKNSIISKKTFQPEPLPKTPRRAAQCLRRLSGFQHFLLQERSSINLKYPFLTPSQIKRKAAEAWCKLSNTDKDNYRPQKPCKTDTSIKKTTLEKRIAAGRSPGCHVGTIRTVSHRKRRSELTFSPLHPVALKSHRAPRSFYDYDNLNDEGDEKVTQDGHTKIVDNDSQWSDESINFHAPMEAKSYGGGNRSSTSITYKTPLVVEDKPSAQQPGILKDSHKTPEIENKASKTRGRVSFGKTNKILSQQGYHGSSDCDPAFSPGPTVSDKPSNWIKEHKQELLFSRQKNPINHEDQTFDRESDGMNDEGSGSEELQLSDSDDERHGQLIFREEPSYNESSTGQGEQNNGSDNVKENCLNSDRNVDENYDRDSPVLQMYGSVSGKKLDRLREEQYNLSLGLTPPNDEVSSGPCTKDQRSCTKGENVPKRIKYSTDKKLLKLKSDNKRHAIGLESTSDNKFVEEQLNTIDIGPQPKCVQGFRMPSLPFKAVTRSQKKIDTNLNTPKFAPIDIEISNKTPLITQKVPKSDDNPDDSTPLMPPITVQETLKLASKVPRKRKRSEMVSEYKDSSTSLAPNPKRSAKIKKSLIGSKIVHCRYDSLPADSSQLQIDNIPRSVFGVESQSHDAIGLMPKGGGESEENGSLDCKQGMDFSCRIDHLRKQTTLDMFFGKHEAVKDDILKPESPNQVNKSDESDVEDENAKENKAAEILPKMFHSKPQSSYTCSSNDGMRVNSFNVFTKADPQNKSDLVPWPNSVLADDILDSGYDKTSWEKPNSQGSEVVNRAIMMMRQLTGPSEEKLWTDHCSSGLSTPTMLSPAMSGISELSHRRSPVIKSDLLLDGSLDDSQELDVELTNKLISDEKSILAHNSTLDCQSYKVHSSDKPRMTRSKLKKIQEHQPLHYEMMKQNNTVEMLAVMKSQDDESRHDSNDLPDIVPVERRPQAICRTYSKTPIKDRSFCLLDLFDEISPQGRNEANSTNKKSRRVIASGQEGKAVNRNNDLSDESPLFVDLLD